VAVRACNDGEVKRRMARGRSRSSSAMLRYHTLDHAWEMEDKELPAQVGARPAPVGPPL
jgi:hypothetical protein